MKFYFGLFLISITFSAFSQANNTALPPVKWQLLDWQKDGYPGMSVEKAYNELLIHKKPLKKIIVAILDDGLDYTHPDLAGMQWTNIKEIPGNGIDDDHNGYTDDVHGWNFVGNNQRETFEEVREYARLRGKFENSKDSAALKADPQYLYWKTIVAAKNDRINNLNGTLAGTGKLMANFQLLQAYWSKKLSNDSVSFAHIKQNVSYSGADSTILNARSFILSFTEEVNQTADSTRLTSVMKIVKTYYDDGKEASDLADTILNNNNPYYYRKKYLKDNPYLHSANGYGNGDIFPKETHGTECAGVIAALRNNHIGGDGITNSVAIMPLRIAMKHMSDEWDKDVANAIRYAADNGAQVISMSFGKYYSPQNQWVRDAVAYAEKKGVLLVHAAMNDALNTDSIASYPQEYYPDKKQAANLINVGASTYDATLVGSFSNYGPHTVDVFAPGVSIYMPTIKGGYERGFGTSFACPMVAGVAALIWSYYPQFTYQQVRRCIEKSATPIDQVVTKPGTTEKVRFSTLSRTGGIVNAYRAIREAENIVALK